MTAATEGQVRLTAQLYDTRETIRRHLGDKFAERMAEFGQVVTAYAEKVGKSRLAAGIEIAKDPTLSPLTVLTVLAATVELVEPSS